MEGDLLRLRHTEPDQISIHSLRMEGDRCDDLVYGVLCISIHSLRMEGDTTEKEPAQEITDFNPLPPHGGRPCWYLLPWRRMQFQSTPSAWRETLRDRPIRQTDVISIHSLRMEGDHRHIRHLWRLIYFNPLPPHGGRPVHTASQKCTTINFNPLPPHGGRRSGSPAPNVLVFPFQSTPSAWRETVIRSFHDDTVCISIHSLRMEGDVFSCVHAFTSRFISIHSLRMEGDCVQPSVSLLDSYFNPLPPHGGRRGFRNRQHKQGRFQSTPSAWRETSRPTYPHTRIQFQSTPSAWRETALSGTRFHGAKHFNPLPPHGGRPMERETVP